MSSTIDKIRTLSVEDGAAQISELMELHSDNNMHISLMSENGESESLIQYINHTSDDYPIIKTSPNTAVPEFVEAKTCTVVEYNALLEKASQNVPDGKPIKLHFKIILSDRMSYQETFVLTENTKKLSDILNNSTNAQKYNRSFLKALKMVSDKENSTENTEAKADSDDRNAPEKPNIKRPVSISERQKILADFAEKYGLGKINIWRKGGNPASYRIAENKDGNRVFNEQLCTLDDDGVLSKEKLLQSLEEFAKSDFFVQYQQKKSVNTTETDEKSDNEQKYPFVSVKGGWNFDKYISPELEEKNYTVPEFNEAISRLNERWNADEYEAKSAFVTLTIHLSETESFEKRMNAEYQFGSLSELLEYETDWFDSETELRKAVKEAENKSTSPELTEKESPNNSDEETADISENPDIDVITPIDSQEKSEKTVDELTIGDVIKFEGENWRITNINGDFWLNLENVDKNSAKSLVGDWKNQLETGGFEYISENAAETAPEHTEKENPNNSDEEKPDISENSDIDIIAQVDSDLHETSEKTVDELTVGDVIKFESESWRITDINGDFWINLENVNKNSAKSLVGNWKEQLIEETGSNLIQVVKTENSGIEELESAETEEKPSEVITGRTAPEQLYRQFAEMFPDIVSGEHTHERYGNIGDALEPLSVEHLGGNRYAFMTYFFQNGDLMRDPDFEFELDHKNKTLNILEYQQDGSVFGTIYQRVHDENNVPDLQLLSALEENFMQNLKNAQNTNRPLTSFTDSNGNKFDENNEPETAEIEEPKTEDKSPELREVLNEFLILSIVLDTIQEKFFYVS